MRVPGVWLRHKQIYVAFIPNKSILKGASPDWQKTQVTLIGLVLIFLYFQMVQIVLYEISIDGPYFGLCIFSMYGKLQNI